jgi:undecaprenyl diphosphate synthase
MAVMGTALDHVMLVGGEPAEWAGATPEAWGDLAQRFGAVAASAGARWLTLRPYGGSAWADAGIPHHRWSRRIDGDGCTVIVDASPDGHAGFAEAVASIPGREEVDEKRVAEALYAPADVEPDLIVIFGEHDRLPPSLVWELAYGELVFSDVPFAEASAEDLQEAIGVFETRDRRFGGLSPS